MKSSLLGKSVTAFIFEVSNFLLEVKPSSPSKKNSTMLFEKSLEGFGTNLENIVMKFPESFRNA